MRHVLMLCTGLIIITFSSGCSSTPKPCTPVPQKCKIPHTPKPVIDHTPCPDKDNACIASRFAKNYEAQKNYGERLEANSEVCK